MPKIRLVLLSLLILAAFAAPAGFAPAWAATASGARLGLHGEGVTRFVMDLSDSVSFKVSTRADPYRVIIDSPGLVSAGNAIAKPWGAVNGLRAEGGRIVLDLRRPAVVRGSFIIPPRDGMGWRLVVDLAETTHEAFMSTVDKGNDKGRVAARPEPKPEPKPAAKSVAEAGPKPVAAPSPSPPPPPQQQQPVVEAAGDRIVVTSPNAVPPPVMPPPSPSPPVAVSAPAVFPVPPPPEPPPATTVAVARPPRGAPILSAPMPPPPERPAPVAAAPVAASPAAAAPVPAPPVPVAPPAQVSPPPPPLSAARPETGPTKARDGVPVIVIDPGHGGVDPGAIGVSGIYEKHITLAMARELKAVLEKNGRYRVHLTRDRDVFIRLRDRVAMARTQGADLFISLHADAVQSPAIRGLSVYTLSQNASDSEAQALAEKENKADLIAGVDLSHETPDVAGILIDLAQRETMNRSAGFATELVDEVGQEMDLLGNTHRFAGFAVLKAPDVPAVLVEMGYLSNEFEEKQLRQPQYRARLAKAIARAVERYFPPSLKAKRP